MLEVREKDLLLVRTREEFVEQRVVVLARRPLPYEHHAAYGHQREQERRREVARDRLLDALK